MGAWFLSVVFYSNIIPMGGKLTNIEVYIIISYCRRFYRLSTFFPRACYCPLAIFSLLLKIRKYHYVNTKRDFARQESSLVNATYDEAPFRHIFYTASQISQFGQHFFFQQAYATSRVIPSYSLLGRIFSAFSMHLMKLHRESGFWPVVTSIVTIRYQSGGGSGDSIEASQILYL